MTQVLDKFNFPSDIAVDSKDNLYVVDTDNNRIQKIQQDRNVTVIGKNALPFEEFYRPSGVAIDSKDNLYVAE